MNFYSIDCLGADPTNVIPKNQRKHIIDPFRSTSIAFTELQNTLWALYPYLTQHHAGKLSLYIGMPMMIKHNKATECCITNGAEGEAVS